MGSPMAIRLAGAFRVNGFDPLESNAQRARDGGVSVTDTPQAAARGMDVVILAVRTLAQVESALFGDRGVVAGLDAGKTVVLTSTVGAPGAREIAEKLAHEGIVLLDLPVSGGPLRAGQGDLLALVSGDAAAIESARPVFERMASTVVTVGSHAGDGQAMKTVNQLLCGVHIAAAAEALALAQGLGIDPLAALDALSAGAASSFMLSNRGPRIVQALQGEDPDVLSRVDIFVKDMGIVTDAGHATHVALPVAAAAEQLYQLAAAAGLEAKDDSTVATILARRTM
jgi:3-hydroxyisobutyrate dehydrogenase